MEREIEFEVKHKCPECGHEWTTTERKTVEIEPLEGVDYPR